MEESERDGVTMVITTNYHTHCHFCDGKGDPEEYVTAAIAQGMTALGFSCHAPVPFPTTYTMPVERFAGYVSRIKALRERYRERIQIYLGLEVDFVPGIQTFQTAFYGSPDLEYAIGSVHYVDHDAEGNPWPIDAEDSTFQHGITTVYGGDVRPAVERYYALIRHMVRERSHQVVGHLDVIKKNNYHHKYFTEEEPWYQAAIEATLAVIAEHSWIVEVNTAGLTKPAAAMYPSIAILKQCKARNIKIMINSDAHTPQDLQKHFTEAQQLLRDVGYREVYQLTPRGWESTPL